MEAGNGMLLRLRQLLSMSTSFKTLGRSCKCSSNEIDLSATSKQIPAAPNCLFAMGLNGDCVNHSAFKGRCQEKFRSSARQWHWNAAFSKMVDHIKPKKKLPTLLLFFLLSPQPSGLWTFCSLSAWRSPQRLQNQAANRNTQFEDRLLEGDTLPRHSAASPPPRYGSISGPGGRGEEAAFSCSAPGLTHKSTAMRAQ